MLAKTAADNQEAAEQVAAAQADYDEAMAGARGEASAIRDEARTEGREVVDESRAAASGEVARHCCRPRTRSCRSRAQATADGAGVLGGRPVGTLASRILGIDGASATGGVADVDLHRTAHRIRCHRLAGVKLRRAAGEDDDAASSRTRCGPRWRRAPRRQRSSPMPTRSRQGASRTPERRRTGHRGGAQRLGPDRRAAARAGRIDAERIKAQGVQQVQLLRQQTHP